MRSFLYNRDYNLQFFLIFNKYNTPIDSFYKNQKRNFLGYFYERNIDQFLNVLDVY